MSERTADIVSRGCAALAPRARYEFAMHGEPLLNPSWEDLVAIFRTTLPNTQLQLTTNGTLILGCWADYARRFMGVGINVLLVDLYAPYGAELREEIERSKTGWSVVDFYNSSFSPWHNHKNSLHVVVLMDDLMQRSGERASRKITNQGGNSPLVPALATPLAKTCTLPFRELSVRHDGAVGVCCNDWRLEYPVGNMLGDGPSVWTSERFTHARRELIARRRSFAPCSACDCGSGSRAGLLPKEI